MPTWGELSRGAGFLKTILRHRPFSVLIQVTNRCNMRCAFCNFWSNAASPHDELSLADFASLEAQLSQLGRFLVSIEGGEPMLRPDLAEIVKIFSRRHLTVLYTNGWFVTAENAHRLFQNGLTQAGVSIDFDEATRHDAIRGAAGASQRAWQAVNWLRDAAPYGGRQVHVMTVYMEENQDELELLLQQSARLGVGHAITLLSSQGSRRSGSGAWPQPGVTDKMLRLWQKYPHFWVFREYLELMDSFLRQDAKQIPVCTAGRQNCNIDHLGNVAPCIEKIGSPVGNIRRESLADIYRRLRQHEEIAHCQNCWTLCRATFQLMGNGGRLKSWLDLTGRMRSY